MPQSNVGEFYYKLNCYNLTTFELNTNDVINYLWAETDGKRGTNEIGTCISRYVKSTPINVKHLILYSDNCSGQNRNKYMMTALLHAVATTHIELIDQKFLTTGHTKMEADSVHAAIEKTSRNVNIFTPHEYINVMKLARSRNPYKCIQLEHKDFVDYKVMNKTSVTNVRRNTKGEKISWLEICHLRYKKGCPEVEYKYEFGDEFRAIMIQKVSTRKSGDVLFKEEPAYQEKLKISNLKKRDLLSL